MAKKSKSAQKREMATEEQARAARRKHVVEQYGEPEFSCDYKIDPYLINEMSLLVGVPNDRGLISILGMLMCAALVIMLLINRSLVGLGIVFVVVIVLVLSAGERINRIKASYLRRHGYDTESMSDQELIREVYVTESDVVVECPGVSLKAYPLSELRYTRSSGEYLLAAFGQARYVIFPRQSFSLSVFTRLSNTLDDKVPRHWYDRFISRTHRKA